MSKESETIKSILKNHIREFYRVSSDTEISSLYNSVIIAVEEALIEETLDHTNGVQTKAAKMLGINRNTLRKKIEQFNIKNDTIK